MRSMGQYESCQSVFQKEKKEKRGLKKMYLRNYG